MFETLSYRSDTLKKSTSQFFFLLPSTNYRATSSTKNFSKILRVSLQNRCLKKLFPLDGGVLKWLHMLKSTMQQHKRAVICTILWSFDLLFLARPNQIDGKPLYAAPNTNVSKTPVRRAPDQKPNTNLPQRNKIASARHQESNHVADRTHEANYNRHGLGF